MRQGRSAELGQRQKEAGGLPLEPGEARVLRWLERYPFQRAQDLIVALSPWEKRTVVYERLAALEKRHLIETLRPGIAQGKKLYHLSPLGTYVCDLLAAPSGKGERQERWEHLGAAQVVREEREPLVRQLPRLPVFLTMQDLVNGLVTHASAALTQHGRRASVVQWSWQRDYRHVFWGPREQRFRLQVEGALTFCLRYASGEPARPGKEQQASLSEEHWYTLLLLHCPLDEIRLVRLRLDRLLRWRESAERTAVYSQMPPLLILATTERQAEWWHLAAMQVAARLRVACPLGALACVPGMSVMPEQTVANGWRWSWRRLGTKEPCHLQELLRPLRQPAVPALLIGRGSASEPVRGERNQGDVLSLPTRLQAHAYALGGKVRGGQATISPSRGSGNGSRDYRLDSLRLTQRHWDMLLLVFAHPLVSRENLSLLLALTSTSVGLLLAELKRLGYLAGVVTPVGERWHLAEDGLRLLARLASCEVQRLVQLPPDGTLHQRGTQGLLHQIHHTAGVYGFFAQLCAELATRPDAQLRWWETGPISERHFTYADKIYRFRPDALAAIRLGEQTFRFWLEWDRGTMGVQDLQRKFTTYGMYLVAREWARSSPYLPGLLCVVPEIAQEQRFADVARACLVQVPAAFRIYTTTAYHFAREGILAPIWQQVVLPTQQRAPPAPRSRIALFEKGQVP